MSRFNANYWRLWSASVLSNFGDGVAMIAYPWLASAITRDGFKLGLVVLAGRLPWLLFSLPAGVIADRVDRRKLIIVMDLFRAVLTLGVAFVVLANDAALSLAATTQIPVPNEDALLTVLIVATFLFGAAEVLRDNSAQTLMPAIVDANQLERANGRLWGAETVMNQFVGPPVGGLLIGMAMVLPFFVHTGSFVASAVLITLMAGTFRAAPSTPIEGKETTFWTELKEGFRWLWQHPVLRPLAISLGVLNASWMMFQATYVLYVQEILGLGASAFGLLMTAGAVGGVLGGLGAARIAERLGRGAALFSSIIVFGVGVSVIGFASQAVLVWVIFVVTSFFVMVWNVITVSLRQRVIPDKLLGRVNSVYRFFGWGMMSIGAVIGGALVTLSDPLVGREWSLRLPFLVAGGIQILMLFYAVPRFNSRRIAEAEAAATAPQKS